MEPAVGDPGVLFVISAPSGTGKSTLARRVLDEVEGLDFSVSYTTRSRRDGEVDGREYRFVDASRFQAMIDGGAFLEWAEVYGKRYGTGREATASALAAGRDLLLDIDVQGARQLRERGVDAVFVFILPPSHAALEDRLRSRRTEPADGLARRLAVARREAEEYSNYDYLVVNDDVERAAGELRAIVLAERRRVSRRLAQARSILATFPAP